MKVLVPLAEGFEETEAVTVIDLLRRADIETITSFTGRNPARGAHGILITADKAFDEKSEYNAIVLPGGMPGSTNLKNDPRVVNLIKHINRAGGLTAAICAAPIVLAEAGILNGKKFTCYPGYEKGIIKAGGLHTTGNTVTDGNIITGIGAAAAPLFAIEIIRYLKGPKAAEDVKGSIIAFW